MFVTKPALPPLDELIPHLKAIWDNGILTNCGPYHARLETALVEYLGVNQISLFANGTLALVTALQTLDISGEVITTPFSFVATAHALLWRGIKPVFVDVDPRTLNIDPAKIEAAITPETTAILAVHCFGHPADVDAIDAIGKRHGLKVIYDAAHAFAVDCHCGSVLNHGDLSVLSFHATKVFSTMEGGAIISPNPEIKDKIDKLKNFGHDGEIKVIDTGLNAKMSEVGAAFGLTLLDRIDGFIDRRREIDARYRARLAQVAGIHPLGDAGEAKPNFAYFPILVGADYPLTRDQLYFHMKAHGVHPRRYFYPLITEFPMYRQFVSSSRHDLPIATQASERVLCLPIYPDLSDQDVDRVIALIEEGAD
ncbi:DegT/DnrJ/EryC1/StrS family aminotransferase [Salipiger pacificus]|uniref:DegT/DnrJ/EryC1/StrS family aminotransferase n=1 Tax=Salipiger mangrovisoli TaxID=2865933 RepID=A0ABR9XBW7_9RHOB|nr:DegT/DnrJ/EryC1/StrS family aminotransferase [Salipiger mangrovisoli]